jgi:putative NADPH-quinone reductase
MPRKITILQGHPDPSMDHYCHAIADAYAAAAMAAGHTVRRIDIAALDFPLLTSKLDFYEGTTPDELLDAQAAIGWAEHVVLVFPLWLGGMPAIVKGFLEQVLRPGFAIDRVDGGKTWTQRLRGRSARIVVTMGMPAFVYRWFFGAHSLRSLRRSILGFCGFSPVRTTMIGNIENCDDATRRAWLATIGRLGRLGQ